MKTRLNSLLLVIAVLGTPVGFTAAQADQRQLAQQLLAEDLRIRSEALKAVRAMGPEKTGSELRVALITLLEREARAHVRAYQTGRGGAVAEFPDEPEFIVRIARVVAPLHDASFIPALVQALGTGFTVIRALVDYGEAAASALLSAVESPSSTHYQADDALIALRLMVEQTPNLSAATRERIRRAAEQRLSGKQYFTTVWWAIDLAIVLGDPALRQIVTTLATDRNAVIARGVQKPDIIDQTQKWAADRLAGVPPLPRR